MKLLKLIRVSKTGEKWRYVTLPVSEFVEAVQCMAGDYDDTPPNANTMIWRREFDDPIYVVETIGDIAKQLEGMPEL
ncbi:hypothetical protein [Achromobacter phage nyashin_LB6]|nr:hypothetical protein Axy18_014 [Achromobacter phage vB_AxyS_19-32_Axy18]QDH84530.1 hypothetical protein Axy20_014 [Achromobacter phage vB_AxyS_19-32_Axy20]WNO48690.1 hypothetical protein [Achromobacter phage nyashin_LB6]